MCLATPTTSLNLVVQIRLSFDSQNQNLNVFHSIMQFTCFFWCVIISQKCFRNERDQTCSIFGAYQFGNLFNCNVMS